MDWAVGLAFPCQQPMLHANGVTEIPKFRITPDYNAKRKDTDTWQDGLNGGLLGITDLLLRQHVMATYLSQDWGRDWGSLRKFDTTPDARDAQPRNDRLRHGHPQRAVLAGRDQDQALMADRIRLGAATAHPRRGDGRSTISALGLFPNDTAEAWADDRRRLLGRTFFDPDTSGVAMQTWVIEVDGLTVVVDTGSATTATARTCRRWIIWTPTSWVRCSVPVSTRPLSTS